MARNSFSVMHGNLQALKSKGGVRTPSTPPPPLDPALHQPSTQNYSLFRWNCKVIQELIVHDDSVIDVSWVLEMGIAHYASVQHQLGHICVESKLSAL